MLIGRPKTLAELSPDKDELSRAEADARVYRWSRDEAIGKARLLKAGEVAHDLWSAASGSARIPHDFFRSGVSVHPLSIQSALWAGGFSVQVQGVQGADTDSFSRIAQEGATDFGASPDSAPVRFWLESLYRVLSFRRTEVTHAKTEHLRPGQTVEVIWLPWNLYVSSAKAIEDLLSAKPPSVGVADRRPAYARDHRWLEWNEADQLTPAKIRDRWNALSHEERARICPTASETIGKGESGRDVVKKALEKARRENSDLSS